MNAAGGTHVIKESGAKSIPSNYRMVTEAER
jgi:hypothetical protein